MFSLSCEMKSMIFLNPHEFFEEFNNTAKTFLNSESTKYQ